MIRDSLLKILDYIVIPASVLVVGKAIGVFVAIKVLNVPWEFKDFTDSIFKAGTVVDAANLKQISTYSDLIMFIFIATLFSLNLIRAIFFHDTHISPKLSYQLVNKDLFSLVQSSYQIYHAAAVNLLFLWITTLLILINSIAERTSVTVLFFALLTTITFTTLLLQDVYREVETNN